MKYGLLLIPLLLMVPLTNSNATLVLYNAELNCPIDSIDFTGTLVEFDYIEMCEVTGNIITLPTGGGSSYTDPIPGRTGEINYQDYIKQLENKTVVEQLRFIFANSEINLKSQLDKALLEKLLLSDKIDILKNKIKVIIAKLQYNLKQADKYGIADRVISKEELNQLIKKALLPELFIQAYAETGNKFVVKEEMKQTVTLLNEYKKTIAENAILQRQYDRMLQISFILEKVFVETEQALRSFADTLIKK